MKDIISNNTSFRRFSPVKCCYVQQSTAPVKINPGGCILSLPQNLSILWNRENTEVVNPKEETSNPEYQKIETKLNYHQHFIAIITVFWRKSKETFVAIVTLHAQLPLKRKRKPLQNVFIFRSDHDEHPSFAAPPTSPPIFPFSVSKYRSLHSGGSRISEVVVGHQPIN